jgi:hypothetical protein
MKQDPVTKSWFSKISELNLNSNTCYCHPYISNICTCIGMLPHILNLQSPAFSHSDLKSKQNDVSVTHLDSANSWPMPMSIQCSTDILHIMNLVLLLFICNFFHVILLYSLNMFTHAFIQSPPPYFYSVCTQSFKGKSIKLVQGCQKLKFSAFSACLLIFWSLEWSDI